MKSFSDIEIQSFGDRIVRELDRIPASALFDPDVVELMLNPDGTVWSEKQGEEPKYICDMTKANAEKLMGTIAHTFQTIVTAENSIIEGALVPLCPSPSDRSSPLMNVRFEGIFPPASDAPAFAMRKRAVKIFDLQSYVTNGYLTETQKAIIEEACVNHENILIVGSTGSGKTTFANAVLDEIARSTPQDRVVTMEDTAELQIAAPNKVSLFTTKRVSMRNLLKATMRLRPDRIIVGEVRGSEALDLLKAWNTGHSGGLCTVHANSSEAGLIRLEQLCAEAGPGDQRALIGEAVHLSIFITRTKTGRVIQDISRVKEFDPLTKRYVFEKL